MDQEFHVAVCERVLRAHHRGRASVPPRLTELACVDHVYAPNTMVHRGGPPVALVVDRLTTWQPMTGEPSTLLGSRLRR